MNSLNLKVSYSFGQRWPLWQESLSQNKPLLVQDVFSMSPGQGFVGVTIARYVYRNSVIKRLSLAVFGVLRVLVTRYVLLVLLEKPAHIKDRKSEFPNKPTTENRPDDSSSKNTE